MDSQTFLITGGAGFIGSHLSERLVRAGHEILIVDNLSTGSEENIRTLLHHDKVSFFRGKISALPELETLVKRSNGIFHLAAAVGVELVLNSKVETIENNVHETSVLARLAAESKVPFLLASTSEVYGKSTKPEFSEEDDLLIGPPTLARWSYACSKLLDEFLVKAYGSEFQTPVVIARLFNTVGPRQTGKYGMVVPRFIRSALKGEPIQIFGNGQQTRCFCHVQDTVEALIRLLTDSNCHGQIYNIGTDQEISITQLARTIIELLGSKSELEFIPYTAAYGPGFEDMLRRKPTVRKLQQDTGFVPPTSLDTIILETASWIKANPGR